MKHKHKKTRKEKIIADYRHQIYILKNKNISIDNPAVTIPINENSYAYVLKDISKTGILTCFIIAAQIVLFFLLKNHVVKIPNISY